MPSTPWPAKTVSWSCASGAQASHPDAHRRAPRKKPARKKSAARDKFRKEKDENIKKENGQAQRGNEETRRAARGERLARSRRRTSSGEVADRASRRPTASEGPQGRVGRDLSRSRSTRSAISWKPRSRSCKAGTCCTPCCCRRSLPAAGRLRLHRPPCPRARRRQQNAARV